MVLSRNLLDLSYMPEIREIDYDVLTMWISLSLNDIAFEEIGLIFSVSARIFAVEYDDNDDADLYIMVMWRLCVTFHHQPSFSITDDTPRRSTILPGAGYGLGTYRTVDIFNFSHFS